MARTFNLDQFDRSDLIEQMVTAMNRRRDLIRHEFARDTQPFEWQLADAALGVVEAHRSPAHAQQCSCPDPVDFSRAGTWAATGGKDAGTT